MSLLPTTGSLQGCKLAEQGQPRQEHVNSTSLMIHPIRNHINHYIADIHTRPFDGTAQKKNSRMCTLCRYT